MDMRLLLSLALFALLLAGCGGAPPANPPITPPTEFTEEQSRQIALEFLKNDETYKFDGIESTLKLDASEKFAYLDNAWTFTYSFDSAHTGYGDRQGQALAQAITPHVARIFVVDGAVMSATLDLVETTDGAYWDMITEKFEGTPSLPT